MRNNIQQHNAQMSNAVINKTYVDLLLEIPSDDQIIRESQLLYGEQCLILQEQDAWSYIEAIEQPWHAGEEEHPWRGYPGWVLSDSLTTHDKVFAPSKSPTQTLQQWARSWIGVPYLWGGMSTNGIDCSGLVHLYYRSLGKVVARNARDQIQQCYFIPSNELELGDLLFIAQTNGNITHVMLYWDDDLWLEATSQQGLVHVISTSDKHGLSLKQWHKGTRNTKGEQLFLAKFNL